MAIHVGWCQNGLQFTAANTTCTNVVQACDVLHELCQAKYTADPSSTGHGEVRTVGSEGRFRLICQSDKERYT